MREATTRFTPVRSTRSITFSAPITLVLMHSNGLYSAAGTCFSAAAWTTMSTPSQRPPQPGLVAHVADEPAHHVAVLDERMALLHLATA